MKTIKIKTELKDWLIDNITNTIHGLEAEIQMSLIFGQRRSKEKKLNLLSTLNSEMIGGMILVMKLLKKKLLNMLSQF